MPKNGVYIGVGPDQNYTYIASSRPKLSFIVDYRPENQLLHLLFKALLDLSENRAQYLSFLFSIPYDDRIQTKAADLKQLVALLDVTQGDEDIFNANILTIIEKIKAYNDAILPADIEKIKEIYLEFFNASLSLRCRFPEKTSRGLPYPTYSDFLLATSQDGVNHNFLNCDEAFLFVKKSHERNRILSITGDFAGFNTLSSISTFCKKYNLKVSVLYISSVEYRLFNEKVFGDYIRNIKSLPLSDDSVIIRAFYNKPPNVHPECVDKQLFTTSFQYIRSLINNFDEGKCNSYWDIGTQDYIQ